MSGWLDRMPTAVRDLLVALVAVVAGWVVNDMVPGLPETGVWALVGPLLVVAANAMGTWTRAYGRGQQDRGAE